MFMFLVAGIGMCGLLLLLAAHKWQCLLCSQSVLRDMSVYVHVHVSFQKDIYLDSRHHSNDYSQCHKC